jgi:phosphoglycolate phosphatase-like HAD superfamily hydrolase
MQTTVNTKLFWDIDGTLIDTKGAAATAFSCAVSDFAQKMITINSKNTGGFTDYEIAINLLTENKIPFYPGDISKILENYIQRLSVSLSETNLQILNRVDLVLDNLLNIDSIEVSVGTGNCLSGARLKLEYAELNQFFSETEVFCATENFWNRDLVIQNAKNSLSKDCLGIIIGDTPKDIFSARKCGLSVISVASGAYSSDELITFDPDAILKGNWEYHELMQAIDDIKSMKGIT